MTPEHSRYVEHVNDPEATCACATGGQCRLARDLLRDADAADWAVIGTTSRERATVAA